MIKGLRLLAIINKIKPDIIHNHCGSYSSNLIILFFWKIPKVYTEHGGEWLQEKPLKQIIFYNCFARFYDLILANSKYVRDEIIRLTKVKPKRLGIFYIGINAEEYANEHVDQNVLKTELGIAREDKVVGIVGRLIERKGVDDFIKIAAQINKIEKGCSYVVVGEGPCRKTLEELAMALNVECHFLGGRSDVNRLLKIFDIFLFTSRSEAFGIVVLEAMAAKVPVLGFATPGVTEIIADNNCGILLPERDHHKLAEAVVETLHDEEKYKRLVEGGYNRVLKYFDIKNSISLLENYYDLLTESRI